MDWINDLGPEGAVVLRCTVNMLIGGGLAIYVRELYKRCSSSISNRESFSGVFPMLTLVTVVIIFVVKSSLALALGLVGALSIVRFRAAIKTPEELVYLFFCIGIGLALGADHRLLAVVAVLIVSLFILGRRYLEGTAGPGNLLLTVTGDASRFFADGESGVVSILAGLTKGLNVQRFDLEDGQVQFRANVSVRGPRDTAALMSELRKQLPHFQVSYVNLDSLV